MKLRFSFIIQLIIEASLIGFGAVHVPYLWQALLWLTATWLLWKYYDHLRDGGY